MSFTRAARAQSRFAGEARLLLVLSIAGCLLQGCAEKKDYKFKPTDVTNFAAPQLNPPLSASDQAIGRRMVGQYIVDIDRKDYAAAEKLFTPQWQIQCPEATLGRQLTSDGFWTMLPHSHDWTFDQFQNLRHGNEMVVHVHFIAVDTNLYRTNFIFHKVGSEWLINEILYPVQKNKAPLVQGQVGGPPQR